MSLYRQLEAPCEPVSDSKDRGLRNFLSSVSSDPGVLDQASARDLVTLEIGCTLFGFMLLPEEDLDVTAALSSLGVDSLIAIEIHNWCRRVLGIDMGVLEISNAKTIRSLGDAAVALLKEKHGVDDKEAA